MSSEETRFKPGQSGNATGRPKLPAEITEFRRQNPVEFERILNQFTFVNTPAELKAIAEAQSAKPIQVMLARLIFEAMKKGDEKKIGFILGHLGIVIKQKISLDGGEDEDGNSKPIQLQRVDLMDRIKQLGGTNGET